MFVVDSNRVLFQLFYPLIHSPPHLVWRFRHHDGRALLLSAPGSSDRSPPRRQLPPPHEPLFHLAARGAFVSEHEVGEERATTHLQFFFVFFGGRASRGGIMGGKKDRRKRGTRLERRREGYLLHKSAFSQKNKTLVRSLLCGAPRGTFITRAGGFSSPCLPSSRLSRSPSQRPPPSSPRRFSREGGGSSSGGGVLITVTFILILIVNLLLPVAHSSS